MRKLNCLKLGLLLFIACTGAIVGSARADRDGDRGYRDGDRRMQSETEVGFHDRRLRFGIDPNDQSLVVESGRGRYERLGGHLTSRQIVAVAHRDNVLVFIIGEGGAPFYYDWNRRSFVSLGGTISAFTDIRSIEGTVKIRAVNAEGGRFVRELESGWRQEFRR
jgi:hypothetical protein